ncbi:MAG: LysR family transcriptional regulator [Comamonadaceae bacterium]|nr:LysR family transcriptional regulator [Pseudomonadota bacterium]MBS0608495.1 LysR family transcriptional regulator [Pseudomonadota bacterium]MDE2413737.1 LysR family transcriptional regulator [Comamonadaceae bacterium]
MNLRHLEYLLAVADTGSFSRAADKCHVTQSALSRSIQALEVELGATLIDRIGKRNELTPFGKEVARRARRMVLDAAEMRRSAEFLQPGHMSSLRIGLGSGPSAMLMRPFLQHMAHAHPGVQVSIQPGATELQVPQLREREFDALVVDMRRIMPAPDLVIEDLGRMRAGFICRHDHPLRRSGAPVSFADMRRHPLASTPLSAEVARNLIARYGPQADPQTAVTLRCDDIHSLLATVRTSDAVFLGIVGAARAGIRKGELAELAVTPALDEVGRFALVTLAARTEAPAMAVFRRFIAMHLND